MSNRKIPNYKRWRGYLAVCEAREDDGPIKGYLAEPIFIHARSPREVIDILGDRLIPHGHGYAKIKVTTLSSGATLNGWRTKSKSYEVFTQRSIRLVREAK